MQLDPTENFITTWRQHWLIWLGPLCVIVIGGIFFGQLLWGYTASSWMFLALGLVVAGLTFRYLWLWAATRYQLTTQRIVLIQWSGFFRQQVMEIPYDRIMNIYFERRGPLAISFNYGQVIIQLQGATQPIVLPRLPAPATAVSTLWELHYRNTNKHARS